VRRVGTSASYEWNWDAVSDEEWQAATTTCRSVRKPSLPIRAEDKAAESNRKTTLPIHIKMNLEEEKPEAQSVSSTTGDDEGANPSVDSKSGNEPQSTITGSDFHIAQAETSDIAQVGTSYTENDTAPPTDIEQAFADFSRHYPATTHSESQHIVRAAFLRAVKAGADPEAIITGASRYASVRDGHDPQYTMAPTNWLRQRRWECLPATTSIAPINTIRQHGNPIPAPAPATAPPRPPTAFEQSVRKGIAKGLTQTSLFIRPVSNGKDHQ